MQLIRDAELGDDVCRRCQHSVACHESSLPSIDAEEEDVQAPDLTLVL